MKGYIYLILIGILMVVGAGNAGTTCYQEQTNETSVNDGTCGLQYNGTYLLGGGGTWSDTGNQTIDKNWSSYSYNSGGQTFLYINYTKPIPMVNNPIWQVKTSNGTDNITIPIACLNTTFGKISFRIESYTSGSQKIDLNCWNGTAYPLILTLTTGWNVFEEGMYWNNENNLQVNFTTTTNWTIGDYYNVWNGTGTNITMNINQFAIGKVYIAFGNGQYAEFYNDNITNYNKTFLVLTYSFDKTQGFTIYDKYTQLTGKLLEIYQTDWFSGYKLVGTKLSDYGDAGFFNTKIGNTYRFVINESGYRTFYDIRTITSTADDRFNFVIVSNTSTSPIFINTTCPVKAITPTSCKIQFWSNETIDSFVIGYTINETLTSSQTWTNQNEGSWTIILSPEYWDYNISITVNSVLFGNMQTGYTNMSARNITINAPSLPTNADDLILAVTLVIMIATMFGAIAEKIVGGSGAYVAVIILTLFSASIGQFLIAGYAIGIVMAITLVKKIIG